MKKLRRMTKKDITGKVVILPLTVDTTSYKYDFEQIGYNSGVYGWNWSAYKKDNDPTWYIQGYRNMPKEN